MIVDQMNIHGAGLFELLTTFAKRWAAFRSVSSGIGGAPGAGFREGLGWVGSLLLRFLVGFGGLFEGGGFFKGGGRW